MKRILSLVLALALMSTIIFVPTVTNAGTDGNLKYNYLTYVIDGDHIEIINCSTTVTSVIIPDKINDLPVTSIGYEAFNSCTDMTSIEIPNTVTIIDDFAFGNCTKLTKVNIPNSVIKIGSNAFANCKELTSLNIPESIVSINDYAFSNCDKLSTILMPDNITNIGTMAFYNTAYYNNEDNWNSEVLYIGNHLIKAKETISSCIIQKGTRCIADNAFLFCNELSSIEIPKSVTCIGDEAFSKCYNLSNIDIENGVTSIGRETFSYCENLKSINIPDSVISIDNYAFYHCQNLADIILPSNIMKIGDGVFYYTAYYNNKNNWTDGVLYIGNNLIRCDPEKIPQDIKKYTINAGTNCIAENAFSACHNLTSITIPNSVTSISDGAFSTCNSLTSINIPSSVTKINESVFYMCRNLKDVYIPNSVTSIGYGAFSSCPSLTNITIPDSVTYIGSSAFESSGITNIIVPNSVKSLQGCTFRDCKSLKSVSLSDKITNIGWSEFDDCKNLTDIAIPNSVISIDEFAFYGCISLANIKLSDNIKSIGDGAFYGCVCLKDIFLPKNIISIGNSAFYCENLTDVYYNGNVSEWENIIIEYGNDYLLNATIHFNSTWPGGDITPSPTPTKEPSHDMPENINNVTINGHGTAFGWFKVLDNNGNPYTNMPVSYRIDGGKASDTITDENGYAGVKIENIKKSKDYSVEVFGTGIPSVNDVLSVTVKPLAFTSSYEATVTNGKNIGIGIGAGGKIGNLEAEARIADIGFDATEKKTLLLTRENVNNKTKLTVTTSENASIALSAKAGLFAGAKSKGIAGSEMSAGDINGKASYGSGIGATFKDDDFDIRPARSSET